MRGVMFFGMCHDPDESRSERIPRSLLRGYRAIRINSTTLRIENSLSRQGGTAGSFNADR